MKKILLGLLSLVFITNLSLKTIKAEDITIDNTADYILDNNYKSKDNTQKADLILDKLFQKADALKNQLDIQDLTKKIDLLADQIKQANEVKPSPVAQGKKSILSKAFGGTKEFYKFVIDKSDKLISKKGAIALLITVGPFVYLYSKHINPKTIPAIIHVVSHSVGSGATEAGGAAVKGAINGGLVEVVKNNKITTAKVVGVWFGLSTLNQVITQGAVKAGAFGVSLLPFVYHLCVGRHVAVNPAP